MEGGSKGEGRVHVSLPVRWWKGPVRQLGFCGAWVAHERSRGAPWFTALLHILPLQARVRADTLRGNEHRARCTRRHSAQRHGAPRGALPPQGPHQPAAHGRPAHHLPRHGPPGAAGAPRSAHTGPWPMCKSVSRSWRCCDKGGAGAAPPAPELEPPAPSGALHLLAWQVLENGVSQVPRLEGRFPQVRPGPFPLGSFVRDAEEDLLALLARVASACARRLARSCRACRSSLTAASRRATAWCPAPSWCWRARARRQTGSRAPVRRHVRPRLHGRGRAGALLCSFRRAPRDPVQTLPSLVTAAGPPPSREHVYMHASVLRALVQRAHVSHGLVAVHAGVAGRRVQVHDAGSAAEPQGLVRVRGGDVAAAGAGPVLRAGRQVVHARRQGRVRAHLAWLNGGEHAP